MMGISDGYTDRSSSEPRGNGRPGVASPSRADGARIAGAVGDADCGSWVPTPRTRWTGPVWPKPDCAMPVENAERVAGDNMQAWSLQKIDIA